MQNIHSMNDDNQKYSKLSFQILLVSILLTFISFLFAFLRIKGVISINSMEKIMLMISILMFISILNGLIFLLKSIIKKEDNSAFKVIGIIGNTFYFMIFLGMIGFIINDIFTHIL